MWSFDAVVFQCIVQSAPAYLVSLPYMFPMSEYVRLMARYEIITSPMSDIAGAVCVIVLATLTRSGNPIATARLEFLVRFRYWLINGGIMTRIAWGKMMCLSVPVGDRPSDFAASVCPFRTDCMPARTISAINDDVYTTSPSSRAKKLPDSLAPPASLPNLPCASGETISMGVKIMYAMVDTPIAMMNQEIMGYDCLPVSSSRLLRIRCVTDATMIPIIVAIAHAQNPPIGVGHGR